jgi:hypothetical protein
MLLQIARQVGRLFLCHFERFLCLTYPYLKRLEVTPRLREIGDALAKPFKANEVGFKRAECGDLLLCRIKLGFRQLDSVKGGRSLLLDTIPFSLARFSVFLCSGELRLEVI